MKQILFLSIWEGTVLLNQRVQKVTINLVRNNARGDVPLCCDGKRHVEGPQEETGLADDGLVVSWGDEAAHVLSKKVRRQQD